jgi:hypothetical protein
MRTVRVEISKEVMAGLFRADQERAFSVWEGVPKTAKLEKIQYNADTQHYTATFSDPSFPQTELGKSAPLVTVSYMAFVIKREPETGGGKA